MSSAAEASALSVSAHGGYGTVGAFPSMNSRRSRPSASIPTGSGTPSKPVPRTARRKARTERECGFDGRRTWWPTRTTFPRFATPPLRTSSVAGRSTAGTLPRVAVSGGASAPVGAGAGAAVRAPRSRRPRHAPASKVAGVEPAMKARRTRTKRSGSVWCGKCPASSNTSKVLPGITA